MPELKIKNMKGLFLLIVSALPLFIYGQNVKIRECYNDNENQVKFCIATDSVTHDKYVGDSFRLFMIVDTKTDNEPIIEKYYLNVNRSADFPYKLNSKFYNETGLIIIEGCATFYLFSPSESKISKQIYPDYTDCEFSDGIGSYIRNLIIKNNSTELELKIDECGIHRFDISDLENIKEI